MAEQQQEQERARDKTPDEKIDEAREAKESRDTTEKPEPEEEHKEQAAEMMTAYEDRPTLVLPGTAGMVSGTAVNDWLDEEGNPKGDPEAKDDKGEKEDEEAKKEQIEKDKAWNEELREAAKQENKGEKSKS